jgi:hypothetical protein
LALTGIVKTLFSTRTKKSGDAFVKPDALYSINIGLIPTLILVLSFSIPY